MGESNRERRPTSSSTYCLTIALLRPFKVSTCIILILVQTLHSSHSFEIKTIYFMINYKRTVFILFLDDFYLLYCLLTEKRVLWLSWASIERTPKYCLMVMSEGVVKSICYQWTYMKKAHVENIRKICKDRNIWCTV